MLMVIGHSGCPDWMGRFIYMFHMPCFFFISGILLNDKYLTDVKNGIIKKLKGYYFPFVKWSLIFLLLHNLFTYLHIYETKYSLQETIIRIVRVFTMTGSEQLLGGYWFLISLTWASIGSILFLGLLRKSNMLTYINILGGVIGSLLIASVEHLFPFRLPNQFGSQTFLALAFFLSGYLYNKAELRQSRYFECLWPLLLFVPVIASVFFNLSMFSSQTMSCLYFIIALSGTIGLIQLTKIFQYNKVMTLFNYIGNKTLYILTFHFLSFKLVSYIFIRLKGLPITDLSLFPVLQDMNSWMWIIYTIVGIVVPLIIWELFYSLSKFRQKNK